jgi:hypothetical protein
MNAPGKGRERVKMSEEIWHKRQRSSQAGCRPLMSRGVAPAPVSTTRSPAGSRKLVSGAILSSRLSADPKVMNLNQRLTEEGELTKVEAREDRKDSGSRHHERLVLGLGRRSARL